MRKSRLIHKMAVTDEEMGMPESCYKCGDSLERKNILLRSLNTRTMEVLGTTAVTELRCNRCGWATESSPETAYMGAYA